MRLESGISVCQSIDCVHLPREEAWFTFPAYNHDSFVVRMVDYEVLNYFWNSKHDRMFWFVGNPHDFRQSNPDDWLLTSQFIRPDQPCTTSLQFDTEGDGIYKTLPEALASVEPWRGCPDWALRTAVWSYRKNFQRAVLRDLEDFYKTLPNHRTLEVHVRRR